MSHNAVTINLGDTLKAVGTYSDANGDPVDLDTAGITVSSTIRNPDGTEEHDLEVTPDPDQGANPGQFTVRGQSADFATVDTIGTWTWLIRYSTGSEDDPDVFSTERIPVNIV